MSVVGGISCTVVVVVVVGLLQCGSCLCCGVVRSVTGVFSLILLQCLIKEREHLHFFLVEP
jgi:undecaprenyl pyrophosphate phosphatase UppP